MAVRLERKRQLKRREEKRHRQETRKYECFRRMLVFLGVDALFDDLPDVVIDSFLEKIGPGVEVVIAEDQPPCPELKEAHRRMAALVKREFHSTIQERPFVLAFEDWHRAYDYVVEGIHFFVRRLRPSDGPRVRQVGEIMREAQRVVHQLDPYWVKLVFGWLAFQVSRVVETSSRVDGALFAARIGEVRKPEGRYGCQIELRRHVAEPRVISYRGLQWKAYRCQRPFGLGGLRLTSWNCQERGIEGPNIKLPVYLSQHALDRFRTPIPLDNFEEFRQAAMVESLEEPVFFRQDVDEYLVEVRMADRRVGYFVAKIFPHLVLIKTFLFLTMNGTPEGNELRKKLGCSGDTIREYQLDHFYTMIGTDIKDDPLMRRILTECGCSHLFSPFDDANHFQWSTHFGKRLKEEFDLREVDGGYKVGQKWVKWKDPA